MKIVAINNNNEDDEIIEIVLDQQLFPLIICDINLSIDNNGCVYIFISIIQRDFVYTGNKNYINEILRAHNSGIGSKTSHSLHIHPYSVFAYICGFN